jgi:predicted amidohydrolase YtcJ
VKAGIQGDGVHIAPLNPWAHIQYAVTGLNSVGQQVNPGQSLTRKEAIRLFTRENAWFLLRGDELGTIEVGKRADIAVLDRDYFACRTRKSATSDPQSRWSAGEVVSRMQSSTGESHS